MADYYTQGVVALELTPDQKVWTIQFLDEACAATRPGASPENPLAKTFAKFQDKYVRVYVSDIDNTLYLSQMDDFNADFMAVWVQCVMLKFDIKSPVGFCYICCCNKARYGGFGGGARVVSQSEIKELDATAWMQANMRDTASMQVD